MKKVINFIFGSNYLSNSLSLVGRNFLIFSGNIGKFTLFINNILRNIISTKFFWCNIKSGLFNIGFCSLPIIGLTGLFTGAVLSAQLYYSIAKFGLIDTIPPIVLVAMLKELGPVLSGLMIVARVGSSMTAEIGSMIVNNQIDALKSLSVNPFKFVYIPRIISMIISAPLLTIISAIVGVIGSYTVMTYFFNFSNFKYIDLLINAFSIYDLQIGLLKAFIFGLVTSIVSCYYGSIAEDGAIGIGKVTVLSVVTSCINILFFNFIITLLFK